MPKSKFRGSNPARKRMRRNARNLAACAMKVVRGMPDDSINAAMEAVQIEAWRSRSKRA